MWAEKASREDIEAMLRDACLLRGIQHTNIKSVISVCVDPAVPPLLVYSFHNDCNLKIYLQLCRTAQVQRRCLWFIKLGGPGSCTFSTEFWEITANFWQMKIRVLKTLTLPLNFPKIGILRQKCVFLDYSFSTRRRFFHIFPTAKNLKWAVIPLSPPCYIATTEVPPYQHPHTSTQSCSDSDIVFSCCW